jgi:DNA polymerase I-like protein with 3'-5' exonuclease and polymerase domains
MSHDEIVVECPTLDAEQRIAQMEKVMCTPPAWADGLPLAVEIKTMERYGK